MMLDRQTRTGYAGGYANLLLRHRVRFVLSHCTNMHATSQKLRRDALDIWQAGVDAVRGDRLVRDNVRVEGKCLQIADETIDLELVRRIVVVGAGKAGAGMAAGLEEALGAELLTGKQVTGWVNVPADCLRELSHIHLHAARPAGVNEPTAAGVDGTRQILKLAASLSRDDLCICLISGGGSALMPAPAPGIELSDKQAVTTCLSAAGANIEQLNIVRKQLSAVKGGGLARACGAARLVSLVISDVLGDPLELIASGPTAHDTSTPQAALDVLQQVAGNDNAIPGSVFEFLRNKRDKVATSPMEKVEANVYQRDSGEQRRGRRRSRSPRRTTGISACHGGGKQIRRSGRGGGEAPRQAGA